ncbi:hypothetical protein [Micromonospora sp. NPDC004551]|uniref:hypothetical protein n=1 Tax=Micromonospora sp. NPDC004551 TaxID=3154284 RepID=UPI0033A766D5
MQVFLTSTGVAGGLEVLPNGRVPVYERVGNRLVGTPLRQVRDVREFGVWLLEREIDPGQTVTG